MNGVMLAEKKPSATSCHSGLLQRSCTNDYEPQTVPPIVHDVLRSPGQPLDPETRTYFDARFGYDFSQVRVHRGACAAEAAAAINASAFTIGTKIVVGERGFSSTTSCYHLLGHELAHVMQQRFAAPSIDGLLVSTDLATERQADRAAEQVCRGDTVNELLTAIRPIVQREEAPKSPQADLKWWQKGLIEAAASPALIMGSTAHKMARATIRGFIVEVKSQAEAKGDQFWAKVKEAFTSPKQTAAFLLHYWWGLVKGIFSPITGLFDLAKLLVKLPLLQAQILTSAWTRRTELAADVGRIAESALALTDRGRDAVLELMKHPIDTVKALAPWFSSVEMDAIAAAESGGHKAGELLMSQLDKPLPKLGEIAGEIVGTVLINIVLLVFTEGIGNAIAQVAARLGELGKFLGKIGKAAEMLSKLGAEISVLLARIGGWIAKAKAAFAKAAETVLKPLAPLLNEFGKLINGLRSFLRKLLGVAEEGTGAVSEQLAGAAARRLEGRAPTILRTAPPKRAIRVPARQERFGRREGPLAGASEQEIEAAVEKVDVPHVTGRARPRIEGRRVPTRRVPRLEAEDLPLRPGEQLSDAIRRIRRIIGRQLSNYPEIQAVWNRAAARSLQGRALTRQNARQLYNDAREFFWREIRNDPVAARRIADAGFIFPGTPGRAAQLGSVGPNVRPQEITVSLDHMAEIDQGNNWIRALDPTNLKFEFSMPNAFREIIQMRHPILRPSQ